MKKKIVSVFICLLFLSIIPIATGSEHSTTIRESENSSVPICRIFGLFPQVSGDNITYMILPFVWYTIQKDRFTGHLGQIIIYGIYYPSPY